MAKDAWTAVAETNELGVGQMKPFTLDGRRLLLVNADGDYFVIDEIQIAGHPRGVQAIRSA